MVLTLKHIDCMILNGTEFSLVVMWFSMKYNSESSHEEEEQESSQIEEPDVTLRRSSRE